MKKVSTTLAKQSKENSQRKRTIGLDLGGRASHYCVLDESRRIIAESKTATSPKAMEAVFGGMAGSRIALETGMHSPWVSRLLRSEEHTSELQSRLHLV